MSIGDYDRRLKFTKLEDGQDDGYTTNPKRWISAGSRKAKYYPAMRKELFQTAGREVTMPVIFELRSDTFTRQIKEAWKIIFEGRTYDIKGVMELGRKEGIRIEAVAGDEWE